MEAIECTLVMPAYNEEECLEEVISDWIQELRSHFSDSFRIVVVNDGSRDKTGEILDKLKDKFTSLDVIHQKNQGHGPALMTAYQRALALDSKYVLHVDSDNQFSPHDFESLWRLRKEKSIVLGWRTSRHDPLHRLVITKMLRFVIFVVFLIWIPDANIPYRLIATPYLRSILTFISISVFAPNIFIAIIAAKDGYNIINIPVTHKPRLTGKISIVKWRLIKVCFKSLADIFALRLSIGGIVATLRTQRGTS